MRYTPRHLRKYIEQGKIDETLWKAHFPGVLESRLPTCEDCDDFKTNQCNGGKDPIECFLSISCDAPENEDPDKKDVTGKRSKEQVRDHRKRRTGVPSSVNIPYDQSKM